MDTDRYANPIPTNASRANVWAFAEDIARGMGFGVGDPIEPIVSELGGRISFSSPVGEERQESILVEPSTSFRIFLPTLTSVSRDRFTIAHELGHFFLHFPLVQQAYPGKGMRATRWVDENNPDLQRCEWEANWFAASFIMPAEDFTEAYNEGGAAEVAALFGVSPKAVEIRAKSLNL